ncbi:MAG: YdcH family protein [Alphaproteobacteria bacterium]
MKKEQERLLLEGKLQILLEEHRDLDEAVQRMSESGATDMLRLQRIKKRKLALKDQISFIRRQLIPDILA